MKKILLSVVFLFMASLTVSAQIMRAEELEKYAKEKYGDSWADAAATIAKSIALDKNNSMTFTQIVDCPGKTENQLYVILNYWYTNTFQTGKAVIQLNDKELGEIIGKGYVDDIAEHSGGVNSYKVNIYPIIKTDIKDGKIRITYTVAAYDVEKLSGGGILSAFGGNTNNVRLVNETWGLERCYPFAAKDSHKKTSSKALVMAYAYSNAIMDKIEEVVKNGMVGNETDNW